MKLFLALVLSLGIYGQSHAADKDLCMADIREAALSEIKKQVGLPSDVPVLILSEDKIFDFDSTVIYFLETDIVSTNAKVASRWIVTAELTKDACTLVGVEPDSLSTIED